MNDTISYYARRAGEYDRVYDLPSWQSDLRQLENGDQFEIIKNFYDEASFRRTFRSYASELVYEELQHFWTLKYRVRG